ncbi:MAG: lactate racemase domain-containing protein [Pyrinomonadaceae bacterium]
MSVTIAGKRANVFGEGSRDSNLGRTELREIVARSLDAIPEGSRIVAIIPDKTRDDITDILLPMAIEELTYKRPAMFEILVAQGTHPAMTDAEKNMKTGREVWADWSRDSVIHDHNWNGPNELIELGEIGWETVSALTDGAYSETIKVTVNRRLTPSNCDYILIFGSVVPHEVAGFAGGAKYLFPGVSGRELTNATHWIGALAGI